jgi:hypothetical protein
MCGECGTPGSACETRFHECLAMEFEDPAFGRVHNLTVSTFMLQHSSNLTREGWLYERDLLREFLSGNKTADQVRRERKHAVDSSKRTFRIKSRSGRPVITRTKWSKTILDVRLDAPKEYCEGITAWAQATLADAESI